MGRQGPLNCGQEILYEMEPIGDLDGLAGSNSAAIILKAPC